MSVIRLSKIILPKDGVVFGEFYAARIFADKVAVEDDLLVMRGRTWLGRIMPGQTFVDADRNQAWAFCVNDTCLNPDHILSDLQDRVNEVFAGVLLDTTINLDEWDRWWIERQQKKRQMELQHALL